MKKRYFVNGTHDSAYVLCGSESKPCFQCGMAMGICQPCLDELIGNMLFELDEKPGAWGKPTRSAQYGTPGHPAFKEGGQ